MLVYDHNKDLFRFVFNNVTLTFIMVSGDNNWWEIIYFVLVL